MIMEILTGSGGDSVLFARYTGGGFCPCQQKRVGGILSGGDFVLHFCTWKTPGDRTFKHTSKVIRVLYERREKAACPYP